MKETRAFNVAYYTVPAQLLRLAPFKFEKGHETPNETEAPS